MCALAALSTLSTLACGSRDRDARPASSDAPEPSAAEAAAAREAALAAEEQARIEETLDGEPAVELHSLALPWPGEDTAEQAVSPEGPALDGDLWGRSRDFDWGE